MDVQAFIFGTFFLASAGASAAYLTVSEIFPMETRALAIAFFYAVGTGIGGIIGPLLFGNLIASGNRGEVAIAFFIGAAVMALGGLAELHLRREGRAGAARGHREAADGGGRRRRREPEHTPDRVREGRGRYRPGPGMEYPYFSPGLVGTRCAVRSAASELTREVEAIGRAVDEGGPVSREELYRGVGGAALGTGPLRARARRGDRDGRSGARARMLGARPASRRYPR